MNALTVALALTEAKALGVDRLDAQLLLARTLARTRSWLLAHDDAALDSAQAAAIRSELLRRSRGEPLAYLVGEKEFHGLMLHVTPAVLVPRPETEMLVDWGLELLGGPLASVLQPAVLDLGTGSGAIALALKHARPGASVSAVDVSPPALAVAAANAQRLSLLVAFEQGHWWDGLTGRWFHLVLSNPPYIEPDDPHLPDLRYEPRIALTPEGGGLHALRTIIVGAAGHLEPGAWLVLEHGHDQASQVRALLGDNGFRSPQTRQDLAGLPRCTGAQWPT